MNRLRAIWNVVRGRPTMYRMVMEYPTLLGKQTGKTHLIENYFLSRTPKEGS